MFVCMCVFTQRPSEGVGSSGAEVTDSCEPLWVLRTDPGFRSSGRATGRLFLFCFGYSLPM